MGKIIAKNPTLLRKRLILSIFSILLVILLLEGCTRLLLDVHPMQERFNLHPAMGWEWSPGYAALETNKGYDYYLEISAQGLPLSPHYEIPKPENHFRVLALGDSITHALPIADSLPACARIHRDGGEGHPLFRQISGGSPWARPRGNGSLRTVRTSFTLRDSTDPRRLAAAFGAARRGPETRPLPPANPA